LLSIANAINKVSISREQSDAIDIGTKCVINKVNCDGNIDLSLNLPFDFFFATTAAFGRFLFVLPDI
jgi:hypothetical protein